MQLLDRVRRTIRAHALADPRTTVVVALSGGSDSVALAHLLVELQGAGELQVAGFAHFNHQLRAAADADERFCVGVAASLDRPILVDREDVGARAKRERRSIEDAARTSRHAFLGRAREHFAADVVALGHTRDDQAETFLLRLLRGAGARGLGGMHPRRGRVIRPVLDCSRADLRRYLEVRGFVYVTDESNEDVSVPRNRVRRELLPVLRERFNPSITEVLADEAALARDEWMWMDAEAGELAARIARTDRGAWHIDAAALNAAPVALARHVVRRLMTEAAAGRPVSFEHVERALTLGRRGGPPADGPGQRVQRIGGDLVLTGRGVGAKGRPATRVGPNLFRYPLSIPGEVRAEHLGWQVSAEPRDGDANRADPRSRLEAVVQLDRCAVPLSVRNRRPGDRFAPAGRRGRRKLQDYFVDHKIARDRRDCVPIVVDAFDRIVWVAGHAIDREFAVTDPVQAVLILRLKLLGGSS